MNHKIIRINKDNYQAFSQLINWRRLGHQTQKQVDFLDEETQAFFHDFDVLDSKTFYIYAIEVEGELRGYINGVVIPKPDPRKGIMYVDELWVPDIYRNKGYASLLMEAIHQEAKALDLWRMRLYVATDNHVARNYYKKVGYKDLGGAQCCEINLKEIFI